jgi:hypothetical protein
MDEAPQALGLLQQKPSPFGISQILIHTRIVVFESAVLIKLCTVCSLALRPPAEQVILPFTSLSTGVLTIRLADILDLKNCKLYHSLVDFCGVSTMPGLLHSFVKHRIYSV